MKKRIRTNQITVNVEVDGKRKARRKGYSDRRRGDDLYRRRGSKDLLWEFFNLATRLRAVETPSTYDNALRELTDKSAVNYSEGKYLEYVELAVIQPGIMDSIPAVGIPAGCQDVYHLNFINHLQISALDVPTLLEWDAACLGADDATNPLKTTSINGEKIRNCMPIWYGKGLVDGTFQTIEFDVEVYNAETSAVIQRWPNTYARRRVQDFGNPGMSYISNTLLAGKPLTETPANWNPLSLTQESVDISQSAYMDTEAQTETNIHIKLVSALHFEDFDTRDTANYKVTGLPSYDATEITFTAKLNEGLKYFLKPKWLGFARQYSFSRDMSYSFETYVGQGPSWNNGVDLTGYWQPNFAPSSISMTIGLFSSSLNGGNIQMTPSQPGYPFVPPIEGVITASLDQVSGSYSVNLPNGTVIAGTGTVHAPSGRWTASGATPAYNYTLFWFKATGAEPGLVNPLLLTQAHILNWQTVSYDFASTTVKNVCSMSGKWYAGSKIGCLPAFPMHLEKRTGQTIWGDVTFVNPLFNFTKNYPDGSQKVYSYSGGVPQAFSGAVMYAPFSSDSSYTWQLPFYKRGWSETEEFIGTIETWIGRIMPASGNLFTTYIDHSFDPIVWKERTSAGAMAASVQSKLSGMISSVQAQINSLAHVRNAVFSTGGTDISVDGKTIVGLPIDVPAGTLCAVLVTEKGKKHYIWRKTASVRQDYDYNRFQAVIRHTSNMYP